MPWSCNQCNPFLCIYFNVVSVVYTLYRSKAQPLHFTVLIDMLILISSQRIWPGYFQSQTVVGGGSEAAPGPLPEYVLCYISYLLLHKLMSLKPTNQINKQQLSYGFCASGIYRQLSWVLLAQDLPRSCNQGAIWVAETLSHFTHVVVGWQPQVLGLLARESSLSHRPLYRVAHTMAADSCETKWENERERAQDRSNSLFITWLWKWYLIASAIFYSWEASQ